MDAALVANSYNSRPNTVNVVAALQDIYLNKTLDKIWNALTFMNDYTDGGFFKLRQVSDTANLKKASYYKIVNGQKVESGWMSQIQGICADKPNKIRGDRTDLLFYEEGGSWRGSTKAFIQGDALVGIQGSKFGIKIIGGTGGDSGEQLEGLRDIYYNPEVYDVLPFRHNYNDTQEYVLTGFFIPAYNVLNLEGYIDNRGYTDPELGRQYYEKERLKKAKDVKALIIYSAEYCFTAEEAFSLEGDNKFNKEIISELLTAIRALKQCPKIDKGYISFVYKSGATHKIDYSNISGTQWRLDSNGKIRILEHPIWSPEYEELKRKELEPGLQFIKSNILHNLYVAGVDGIDIGKSQTSDTTKDPSDFCITIKKRVYGNSEPQYVAIYKDRPDDIRDAYKIAIGLAIYYNCKINIEATRMSFVTWAREHGFLGYFMKRPSATYPDITKKKSTLYGSPATEAVISHQTDLIAAFINDYGYTIWFEEMLDELNRYSDEAKRKFDIVAAMGETELADEELGGTIPKPVLTELEIVSNVGYYTDENGIKRFGVIPTLNKFNTNYNTYYSLDYSLNHSSDPRYR